MVATLLAVLHRDRTGTGQSVTGSLLGGAVLTNSETFLDRAAWRPGAPGESRADRPLPGLPPLPDGRRLDRPVRPATTHELAASLRGRSGWTIRSRSRRRWAVDAATTPSPPWHAAGVPCEPVRLDQGRPSSTIRSTGPSGSSPPTTMPTGVSSSRSGPFGTSATSSLRWTGPRRRSGQHTVEVLREVGLEPDAIDRIRAEGAALQYDPSRRAGAEEGAGQPDRFELARRQHARRGAGSSEEPVSSSTEGPR